jgi:cell division septal protein FtsQ
MLKFFLKLVVLLFAVAGGRLAYDQALGLPPFALKQVKVTGNLIMPQDSLLSIAGLEKGKSIYKQDLKYAVSKIMSQPGVIECSVQRGLISDISIDVKVAEPALLVNSSGLKALSREGMILPMSAKMPILPLVSGKIFQTAVSYDRIKDPDIAYALEAYDALMAASPALCARLSEINFREDGALRLYFSPAGTEVLIDKSDIKNSIKRLSSFEDSGAVDDTTVFDMRFGPVMIESPNREGTL